MQNPVQLICKCTGVVRPHTTLFKDTKFETHKIFTHHRTLFFFSFFPQAGNNVKTVFSLQAVPKQVVGWTWHHRDLPQRIENVQNYWKEWRNSPSLNDQEQLGAPEMTLSSPWAGKPLSPMQEAENSRIRRSLCWFPGCGPRLLCQDPEICHCCSRKLLNQEFTHHVGKSLQLLPPCLNPCQQNVCLRLGFCLHLIPFLNIPHMRMMEPKSYPHAQRVWEMVFNFPATAC